MPRSAGYTRFVEVSKRSLWFLVAFMVGLVIWIASYNSGENGARMVFSNAAKSVALQNIMNHPHYQGVDIHNRPYTVIAEKALQIDKDNVSLDRLSADMVMSNGSWIVLNAGKGLINLQSKQMELSGGVDVFYEGGYEFRTEHAHVDINKGSAYGDARVEGQGPLGTLVADGFTIGDKGETIKFNGSVRMKLYRH